MGDYEKGLELLDNIFGIGKDNIISLGTVALEAGSTGLPRPVVRGVDALYEDGVFYITTTTTSNKMKQIEKNPEVSIASLEEMFTASGIGENLGWVLKPENSELRVKLRKTFANWYDSANDEKDENCCILAIRLTKGTLNINHWEKLYHMDFVNKKIMDKGGIY